MAGFCVRPMGPAPRDAPDPVFFVYSPRETPAACAGWPSHGRFVSSPPLPFGGTMKLTARVLGIALAAGAMLAVSHSALAQLPQPEGGPVKPIVEPTPTMNFSEMEHDFGKIFENK